MKWQIWKIDEKIVCEEYTLDWSQSKVFLCHITVNVDIMQGFGCFSGFIAAAFVAYLTLQKIVNSSMTSYQVFRKTLAELGKNVFVFCVVYFLIVVLYLHLGFVNFLLFFLVSFLSFSIINNIIICVCAID